MTNHIERLLALEGVLVAGRLAPHVHQVLVGPRHVVGRRAGRVLDRHLVDAAGRREVGGRVLAPRPVGLLADLVLGRAGRGVLLLLGLLELAGGGGAEGGLAVRLDQRALHNLFREAVDAILLKGEEERRGNWCYFSGLIAGLFVY